MLLGLYRYGLVLLFLLSPVQAQDFANLTITPYGDEQFDLATSVTTLLDGGEIYDAAHDLRLEADYIQYQNEMFIQAREVKVEGRFGRLLAANLHYDLASARIEAEGEVQLVSEGLELRSDSLSLLLESGIVQFSGRVQSDAPQFEAAALLYDTERLEGLLQAPYSYQDDVLTLSSSAPGDLLELRQHLDESRVSYEVSSEPAAALLERFAAYLP